MLSADADGAKVGGGIGAFAGAKGALIGAGVGAIIYSLVEVFTSDGITIQTIQPEIDAAELGLLETSPEFIVGKLHNEVINSIYTEYPDLEGVTFEQVVDEVKDEIISIYGIEGTNAVNSIAMTQELNAVIEIANENKSISEEVGTLHPEMATEFEIINVYCDGVGAILEAAERPILVTPFNQVTPPADPPILPVVTVEEMVNQYTDGYIETIEAATIDADTKESLIMAVVVARFSSNLWKVI